MEARTDDFKWFGEGFNGFPKRLPEDSVEYSLFIINPELSPKEVFTRLETVRKESQRLSDTLLKEYIWQRDSFKVEQKDLAGRPYLHGLTSYGDSVEDEWLIVYILRELSKTYPDLWIKIVDTDGEFLLIEAANALPRWLNPEVADNRVWINSGSLRILPLKAESKSGGATRPISRSLPLSEALGILTNDSQILINSPLLEEEAFFRLRNYPAQITASLHHAFVTVPRKLVYILHSKPSAVAAAVEAFYLRDPIALRPLQSASAKLNFPPDDLVTVSVKFTRVLFAQLKSQQFSIPPAWKKLFTDMENANSKDNPKMLAQADIGMKLSSGFEMLVGDVNNKDNRTVREIEILLADLEDGESLPTDAEIAAWPGSTREDDDGWLDINFEDFEKELSGKNKKGGKGAIFGPELASGFGDAKTQADLKKIVERFEAFLNDDKAGPEGAELDDMDFDDEDDDEDDEDESEDGEDKDISFDEKEFTRMMREMMGFPSDGELPGGTPDSLLEAFNHHVEEVISSEEDNDDEDEQIRILMEKMEAELTASGALDAHSAPRRLSAMNVQDKSKSKGTATGDSQSMSSKGNAHSERRKSSDQPRRRLSMAEAKAALKKAEDDDENGDVGDDDEESDTDRDVAIDFNLAQNLLESFKAQAGMAGPGGNLMGLMGMRMPRDEGEAVDVDEEESVLRSRLKGKSKE